MLDAKTRRYIYGVIGTIVPLLVTLGILAGDVAGHIMAIAASVLALGSSALAINNITEDEL
jgi:hypothetical protein